jgi:hypothetical protein
MGDVGMFGSGFITVGGFIFAGSFITRFIRLREE